MSGRLRAQPHGRGPHARAVGRHRGPVRAQGPPALLRRGVPGLCERADDAWAPRYFADRGIEMMVAQSYSKNLGAPRRASAPMGWALRSVSKGTDDEDSANHVTEPRHEERSGCTVRRHVSKNKSLEGAAMEGADA